MYYIGMVWDNETGELIHEETFPSLSEAQSWLCGRIEHGQSFDVTEVDIEGRWKLIDVYDTEADDVFGE